MKTNNGIASMFELCTLFLFFTFSCSLFSFSAMIPMAYDLRSGLQRYIYIYIFRWLWWRETTIRRHGYLSPSNTALSLTGCRTLLSHGIHASKHDLKIGLVELYKWGYFEAIIRVVVYKKRKVYVYFSDPKVNLTNVNQTSTWHCSPRNSKLRLYY